MTRAAEFCYIVERGPGVYLMAACLSGARVEWTPDPDLALRCTDGGRYVAQKMVHRVYQKPIGIGFRKVLAG